MELVKIKSVITDTEFVREFIEMLVNLSGGLQRTLLSTTLQNIVELMKLTGMLAETEFVVKIIETIFSVFHGRGKSREALQEAVEIFANEDQIEITRSVFNNLIKLLSGCKEESMGRVISNCIITITQKLVIKDPRLMDEILKALFPILQDSKPKNLALFIIDEFIKLEILTKKNLVPDLLKTLSSVFKSQRRKAEEILVKLLKISGPIDDELFNTLTKDINIAFEDSESENRSLVFSLMTIHAHNDTERIKHFVNASASLLQKADYIIRKFSVLPALKANIVSFLQYPNILIEYLNHSLKDLRDVVNSTLLECFEGYITRFQSLDRLFQTNNLAVDEIKAELFHPPYYLSKELAEKLRQLKEQDELRSLLTIELNHIQGLRGPQVVGLTLAITGQASLSEEGSEGRKLVELARETLMIQLRCLTEKELTWINENHEWLVSLSPETKLFYKKIYHKLLEDNQVNPLEEELTIKFINQGLTTSLTREGGIIFEGKRYKLQGKNIELAVEKIAKIIISQQQDILASQYKVHEPIFKKKFLGGMREAAADKKEVRSLIDSRHVLQNDSCC